MCQTQEKQALLVTTKLRGVFFGYGIPTDGDTITLERARMCVYWSKETRGVLGLAATGPAQGSRITSAVPSITLREVDAVAVVSTDAIKAWEKGIWLT